MTMKLKFTVGDNNNENYRREGVAEVEYSTGLLIQKPYDDVAENAYNNFCDFIVPRIIKDLPSNWYFIDSPERD